jgi:hypothetical protein
MAHIIRKTAVACGVAGVLAVATPSLAQVVVVDPYYGGPYGAYAGPYGGYAYVPVPTYRAYRYWDTPAGYDSGGQPYSYRDLGWQPGPPGGAPSNPCHFGLREQNRC